MNNLMRAAERCFVAHAWALPPNARWDVTDFGRVSSGRPDEQRRERIIVPNHEPAAIFSGAAIEFDAGSRITLLPEFYPLSQECALGEISTAYDDTHDNYFVNPNIGRYLGIEEDEAAIVKLVSEE
jgi:D-lyxose ketol-isomerase